MKQIMSNHDHLTVMVTIGNFGSFNDIRDHDHLTVLVKIGNSGVCYTSGF